MRSLPFQVGIHCGVPDTVYHADPVPAPSLSSSIAKLLADQSARHAWWQHPRLNTMREPPVPTPVMEEGTLLHAMLLGLEPNASEGDFDDWRTKAAQQFRTEARECGKVPILGWRMAELERCAAAFHEQLADHEECSQALTDGEPEATLIWREDEAWCRSRVDWLPNNPRAPLIDIKTTGGSADPDTWERKLREDYAFQAAFYLRGARACGLDPAGMVFLVVETDAPHGMCAFEPRPDLLEIAEQDVADALDLWQDCMRTGVWPCYPRRICHVDAPAWMLAKAEERAQLGPIRKAAVRPTRAQIQRHNENMLAIGRVQLSEEVGT